MTRKTRRCGTTAPRYTQLSLCLWSFILIEPFFMMGFLILNAFLQVGSVGVLLFSYASLGTSGSDFPVSAFHWSD